jgi:hypothetical protein
MELDLVYVGSAVGLVLLAFGELFAHPAVALAGVGVFAASVLGGFPLLTARLVAGTVREGRGGVLDAGVRADRDRNG